MRKTTPWRIRTKRQPSFSSSRNIQAITELKAADENSNLRMPMTAQTTLQEKVAYSSRRKQTCFPACLYVTRATSWRRLSSLRRWRTISLFWNPHKAAIVKKLRLLLKIIGVTSQESTVLVCPWNILTVPVEEAFNLPPCSPCTHYRTAENPWTSWVMKPQCVQWEQAQYSITSQDACLHVALRDLGP